MVRWLLILLFIAGMAFVLSDAKGGDHVYHMYFGILCIVSGLVVIYNGIGIIKTRLVSAVYGRKSITKIGKVLAGIIGTNIILCGAALMYVGIRVLLA